MKRLFVLLSVSVVLAQCPVHASTLSSERLTLSSRVQAMSHGYHSEAEWQDVFERLAALRAQAERIGDHEEVVELTILEAMIQRDMRGDSAKAIELLDERRQAYHGQPVANLKRVYVEMARTHARTGNETAISRLIEEFRGSPHFDPVTYPFEGGRGPDVPLAVTRPHAAGDDSITVSTMERYRTEARYSPGRSMPEISGMDRAGRHVRLSDLRGSVVLVDFWIPGFTAWERDVANLVALHQKYRPAGFEILGIPLARDEHRIDAVVRQHGMAWPQIRVETRVSAQFGIFGDARNFLVDRNGMIVGRDLRGSDLADALRVMLR